MTIVDTESLSRKAQKKLLLTLYIDHLAIVYFQYKYTFFFIRNLAKGLQCWSEIIETNAKNGVVFDATSNEQPI